MFGIQPTNNSIINRLYDSQLIDAPILSISKNTLTVGALDNQNCNKNWAFYPTIEPNSWTIHVDSINFESAGQFRNQKVLFPFLKRLIFKYN
jgi:hypothetical protein